MDDVSTHFIAKPRGFIRYIRFTSTSNNIRRTQIHYINQKRNASVLQQISDFTGERRKREKKHNMNSKRPRRARLYLHFTDFLRSFSLVTVHRYPASGLPRLRRRSRHPVELHDEKFRLTADR